jgi:hypothetical protein
VIRACTVSNKRIENQRRTRRASEATQIRADKTLAWKAMTGSQSAMRICSEGADQLLPQLSEKGTRAHKRGVLRGERIETCENEDAAEQDREELAEEETGRGEDETRSLGFEQKLSVYRSGARREAGRTV